MSILPFFYNMRLMSFLDAFCYTFIVDEEIVHHLISVVVYVTENLSFMTLDFEKHIYVIALIRYVSLQNRIIVFKNYTIYISVHRFNAIHFLEDYKVMASFLKQQGFFLVVHKGMLVLGKLHEHTPFTICLQFTLIIVYFSKVSRNILLTIRILHRREKLYLIYEF